MHFFGTVNGGSHMRGITGRTTRTVVLLAALMVLPGQQSLHLLPRPAVLSDSPVAPATVTATDPDSPVSVAPATGSYVGGVPNAAAPVGQAAAKSLPSNVLAAYTLAIAVAPPGCHLTLPLLAAIGQVESGNLAGHAVDAKNRVTPAIIGPVLNGKGNVRAVADTDGGQWDGSKKWDRALGPFQFIPSSWRVAGVDMDADGVRDPQNIYDAAGAAMVYLCAGGRDLATPAGLRQGVLAYNHSTSYLELVLAWKAVLDDVDLNGVERADGLRRLGVARHADRGTRRSLGRGRHSPARRSSPGEALHPGREADADHARRSEPRPTPSTAPAPAPSAATDADGSDPDADPETARPRPRARTRPRLPSPCRRARSPPTTTRRRLRLRRHRPPPRSTRPRARRPARSSWTRPIRTPCASSPSTPTGRPRPRVPTRLRHRAPRPDAQSNCERFTENTKRRPGYSLSDQSRSVPGQ